MRALVLALLCAACVPAAHPSLAYGDALRACDSQPSEQQWTECCVRAARSYHQDPGFCFQ